MFSEMVIKKDASVIPKYYHKDLAVYTNGTVIDYKHFLNSHIIYYKSSIEYAVKYQEDSFIEEKDKIAARLWITITKPQEPTKEVEVILIAQYKDGKIHKVWELTYPDWRHMSHFKK